MEFELKASENPAKFYDEILYITAHYKSFLKNPQKFVGSYIKNMFYLTILFLIISIYLIASAIITSHLDGFEGGMIAFCLVIGMFCLACYLNGKKQIKTAIKVAKKSKIKFDENMIVIEIKALDNRASGSRRINWDDIIFIKKNNLSIAIFTKSEDLPFFAISKNNQDKFLEALEHYNKTDLLVRY